MRRITCAILFALLVAIPASAATPTALAVDVTTIPGQAIITFTEAGCAMGSYKVWMKPTQITAEAGATQIATLGQDSGRLLYDDSAITNGQNLTSGLIVTQQGSRLASNKGLLVRTIHSNENGSRFYAVTSTCDSTVTVGTNSLTSAVTEAYTVAPGAIQISHSTIAGGTLYRYFMWADYSTWQHTEWNYYGRRYNVFVPTSGISAPFPMLTVLHGAGTTDYFEPVEGGTSNVQHGVVVWPVELDFASINDPYTGVHVPSASWIARFSTADDLWITTSEDFLVRVARIIRDNATGDSVNFQIDPNRVYLQGASLGSSATHIAGHYPTVYAAAEGRIGFATNDGNFFAGNRSKKVNSVSGPTIDDYVSFTVQAAQVALPMLINTFGANDSTAVLLPSFWPAPLAAFQTYHQPFMAEWFNTGHTQCSASQSQWDASTGIGGYLRIKLNEAYPAFSNAASNSSVPSFPVGDGSGNCGTGANTGGLNRYLDWSSANHDLSVSVSDRIVDASYRFSISLKTTSGSDTTATVTPRNVQGFHPVAGNTLRWKSTDGIIGNGAILQSGTVVVAADGTFTIPSLTIKAAGNRVDVVTELPANTDYSSLPYCSASSLTTMVVPEGTLTITGPTTAVPASSNNFKVLLDGVQVGSSRGFGFIKDASDRVYVLSLAGKWFFWDEGVFTSAGGLGDYDIDPLLAVNCRLPASPSGSVALQGNTFLVDSYGGIWVAGCSEDPAVHGYGLYCPDFTTDNTGQPPGSILRNSSFFPVPNTKNAMMEPNNVPWSLKYCNGTMYLLEFNANPAVKAFTKWVGPGQNTWLDATGDTCLGAVQILIKRRLRFRQ